MHFVLFACMAVLMRVFVIRSVAILKNEKHNQKLIYGIIIGFLRHDNWTLFIELIIVRVLYIITGVVLSLE